MQRSHSNGNRFLGPDFEMGDLRGKCLERHMGAPKVTGSPKVQIYLPDTMLQ